MAVNLSIKNVPEVIVEKLRKRATQHHRSLQGELMTILEESLGNGTGPFPVDEVLRRLQEINLKTRAESARVIREIRNKR